MLGGLVPASQWLSVHLNLQPMMSQLIRLDGSRNGLITVLNIAVRDISAILPE